MDTPPTQQLLAARIALATLAIAPMTYLFVGARPWENETMLRMASGQEPFLRDLVATHLWVGCLLSLLLLALLAVSAEWWIGSAAELSEEETPETEGTKRKWPALTAMLLAVTIATVAAYPRLEHSLWGDEDYSVRHHIHGHFKRDLTRVESGRPYFRLLLWQDAAFAYNNTNNHFLYTITGKLSLLLWQKATGAPEYEFNERALRIAPFILGVLSAGVWVGLAFYMGLGRVGWLLTFLLPWHPWFVRYISEARGYAFVLFFLPIAIWALHSAINKGRWRSWITFGTCQILALYSWPGVAPQIVGLNLMAFGFLLIGKSPLPRLPQLKRWTVVNLVGLAFLATLISPCISQVSQYLAVDQLSLPMTKNWREDTLGLFFNGTVWRDFYGIGAQTNPIYVTLTRINEASPGVFQFLSFVLILAFLGIGFFAYKVKQGVWFIAALILPSIAFYLYGHFNEKYLFPWYFVIILPVFLLLVASGLNGVLDIVGKLIQKLLPHHLIRRVGWCAAALLFVGGYFVYSLPKLKVLRSHSVDPLRESVAATRITLDPTDPNQDSVLTGHAHFGAFCYDPYSYPIDQPFSQIETIPGLTKMMRWADERKVAFHVNMGFVDDARETRKDLMDILDNRDLFHPPRIIWAQEPQLVRQIFTYKGGFFPTAN